jgi:hypothetical protein
LYLGVTTCCHCKKRDMKWPAAHFHNNPACSAHFTQIAWATIEQSLASRWQQEEHDSEPLEWVWQDLHDDDKTCMQTSYWELILENGQ